MQKVKVFLGYATAYVLVTAIAAITLCWSSGTWTNWLTWIYAGLMGALLVFVDDSGSVDDFKPNPNEAAKDYLTAWLFVPSLLATWAVAGLDVGRFHWSTPMPIAVQIVGFVGLVLAGSFSRWAIVTNRFFSGIIRIQEDRGHSVITAGPYQFVRHPAYSGLALIYICSAFALRSWWALVPVGLTLLLFLRRITMEEKFLGEKLSGYREYSEKVRYRLLPGIW